MRLSIPVTSTVQFSDCNRWKPTYATAVCLLRVLFLLALAICGRFPSSVWKGGISGVDRHSLRGLGGGLAIRCVKLPSPCPTLSAPGYTSVRITITDNLCRIQWIDVTLLVSLNFYFIWKIVHKPLILPNDYLRSIIQRNSACISYCAAVIKGMQIKRKLVQIFPVK